MTKVEVMVSFQQRCLFLPFILFILSDSPMTKKIFYFDMSIVALIMTFKMPMYIKRHSEFPGFEPSYP